VDAGHLAVGAAADVCVFDPAAFWRVEPRSLRSQGKNTPYLGLEVPGRVRFTLIGGAIVFEQ
jgi:dihydroorotase